MSDSSGVRLGLFPRDHDAPTHARREVDGTIDALARIAAAADRLGFHHLEASGIWPSLASRS